MPYYPPDGLYYINGRPVRREEYVQSELQDAVRRQQETDACISRFVNCYGHPKIALVVYAFLTLCSVGAISGYVIYFNYFNPQDDPNLEFVKKLVYGIGGGVGAFLAICAAVAGCKAYGCGRRT